MNHPPPLLEIRNVSQFFGGIRALKNISMDIRHGEIRGLIGPNGAGKTTLFNLITGIYTPSEGDILFKEGDISGDEPNSITERGIARTFQNIRLFSHLTVFENVMVGAYLRYQSGIIGAFTRSATYRADEERGAGEAMELLRFFGLDKRASDLATALPYGDQRKLEMARALATRPELLLLDEPAAGMNDAETDELMRLIKSLTERHLTILVIEHHMKLVMGICDRIVVLDHGENICDDVPSGVQKNPRVIQAYLGQG